jgi:hypothetical protein
MLFGGIQVVPFIEYTRQPKMRFVDNLKRLITCQLQDALVGLRRLIKFVFGFLYLTQADCRQDCGEDIAASLAESYAIGKGMAGCVTLALEDVGKP